MDPISKPRRAWAAGLLTLLTIGLGHIYVGRARKGIYLYFLQFAILAPPIILYLSYPHLSLIVVTVFIGLGYAFFCLLDAIFISRRVDDEYHLKSYNRWYIYVGFFLVSSLLIELPLEYLTKKILIQAYKIPSGAMLSTVEFGDHIMTNKFVYRVRSPRRGEIVVFPFPKDPSVDYIKRLIALEGDRIEIRDKAVFLNGTETHEPYASFTDTISISGSLSPRDNFGPVTIPAGKAFAMGDNRDNSNDSRFWGYVDLGRIKGKAIQIYWSWDPESSSVRWDRIGLKFDETGITDQ